MKNEKTNAIIAAIEAAEKEPKTSAEQLLKEILPLLQEYFLGKIEINGNALTVVIPNGQKFMLSATEV